MRCAFQHQSILPFIMYSCVLSVVHKLNHSLTSRSATANGHASHHLPLSSGLSVSLCDTLLSGRAWLGCMGLLPFFLLSSSLFTVSSAAWNCPIRCVSRRLLLTSELSDSLSSMCRSVSSSVEPRRCCSIAPPPADAELDVWRASSPVSLAISGCMSLWWPPA